MGGLLVPGPFGALLVVAGNDAVTGLSWARPGAGGTGDVATSLQTEAARQLRAYFAGRLRRFDLPLAPRGSDFQTTAWRVLVDIPYGETWSYGELAAAVGSAARAVARACAANPIAVVIPCHRVIGSDRRLTGYSGGLGLVTKRALLEHEGAAPARSAKAPERRADTSSDHVDRRQRR